MKSEKEKPRTIKQNKALWLMFQLLADTLNDAGLDQRKVLRHDIEIPWTKQSAHDQLWIPIQQAMFAKDSTTDLTTKNLDAVFETLNRHLGEKLGVHVAFPSIDTILDKQRELER